MRKDDRVEVWVHARASAWRECYTSPRAFHDFNQPAPVRNERRRRRNMARRDDKGKFLQGLAINGELSGQTIERVDGTLNLVAMQVTVENCKVDATLCMQKPQLINHQHVVSATMMPKIAAFQREADRCLVIQMIATHMRMPPLSA